MRPKILFIYANYTNDDRLEIIRQRSYLTDSWINRVVPQGQFDIDHEVIDMSVHQNGPVYIKRICRFLGPNDRIVFLSLMDISPRPADAFELLEDLHANGRKMYILSFSIDHSYASYRDKIRAKFSQANAIKKRHIIPKHNLKLLEFAASLRLDYPAVTYKEITKHTGIPSSTLNNYIKRTYGNTFTRKVGDRSLTDKEIKVIRILKKEE